MNFAQADFLCLCMGFLDAEDVRKAPQARNRPRGEEVMMREEWIRKGDERNVRKIKEL